MLRLRLRLFVLLICLLLERGRCKIKTSLRVMMNSSMEWLLRRVCRRRARILEFWFSRRGLAGQFSQCLPQHLYKFGRGKRFSASSLGGHTAIPSLDENMPKGDMDRASQVAHEATAAMIFDNGVPSSLDHVTETAHFELMSQ